ncbi:hypothetical protein H1C71_037686 [Ictidomys tridecemlineatus]|nr:hypothetical protein H1C71_037686 [Ictidomys tridecemlineatus]
MAAHKTGHRVKSEFCMNMGNTYTRSDVLIPVFELINLATQMRHAALPASLTLTEAHQWQHSLAPTAWQAPPDPGRGEGQQYLPRPQYRLSLACCRASMDIHVSSPRCELLHGAGYLRP